KGTLDRMRAVEGRLAAAVVREAAGLREEARLRAILTGAGIVLLVALMLLITGVLAASLARPLRRLHAETRQIAERRLPATVAALGEAGDATPAPRITPIGVPGGGEIGEIARAFDAVHREAVRLAAEQ